MEEPGKKRGRLASSRGSPARKSQKLFCGSHLSSPFRLFLLTSSSSRIERHLRGRRREARKGGIEFRDSRAGYTRQSPRRSPWQTPKNLYCEKREKEEEEEGEEQKHLSLSMSFGKKEATFAIARGTRRFASLSLFQAMSLKKGHRISLLLSLDSFTSEKTSPRTRKHFYTSYAVQRYALHNLHAT